MSENDLILWAVQLFVSMIDFMIMYLIAHALMWKYIEIKKEHILLGAIFTILTSLGYYFFDGWSARVASHLLGIVMIKKIIKRVDWEGLLIIYLVWIVKLGVIQGLLLLLVSPLSLDWLILRIIIQPLTAIAVFFLCRMFKWYRFFHTIRANITLKLILFTMCLVVLIFAFILNFNPVNILFSSIAIIVIANALFPIFFQSYRKNAGIISIDDLKIDLFTTGIDMVEEPDSEVRYQIYAELAKQYGVDVTSFPADKKRSDEEDSYL